MRRLKVPDHVAALIRGLHPDLKHKVRSPLGDRVSFAEPAVVSLAELVAVSFGELTAVFWPGLLQLRRQRCTRFDHSAHRVPMVSTSSADTMIQPPVASAHG